MLDELDSIDWPSLQHMYGSAEELPGWIRDLHSNDEWVRDDAIEKLGERLYHQDSVGNATAVSIPFLIGLLDTPGPQDREGILELLGVFVGEFRDARAAIGTKWEAFGIATGREWEGVLLALQAGITTFLGLLTDSDPKIRVLATFMLSIFGAERPYLAPALWRVVEHDHDPRAAVAALLCLDALGAAASENPSRFTHIARSDSPATVRYVTAIEAIRARKRCDKQDLANLVAIAPHDINSTLAHPSWSCWGSWLDLCIKEVRTLCMRDQSGPPPLVLLEQGSRDVTQDDVALARLMIDTRWGLDPRNPCFAAVGINELLGVEGRELILRVVSTVPWKTQSSHVLTYSDRLLRCLFARHVRHHGSAAPSPSGTQRAVLTAIAECSLCESDWWAPELAKILRAYALPDAPAGLRAVLAGAAQQGGEAS